MANSLRDMLRAKTLGSAPKFARETVEIDGQAYELKQPSLAERDVILTMAGIKAGKGADVKVSRMAAIIVISLCVLPGTNEKVFEEGDLEALMEYETGSWVDKLAEVGMKLLNIEGGTKN